MKNHYSRQFFTYLVCCIFSLSIFLLPSSPLSASGASLSMQIPYNEFTSSQTTVTLVISSQLPIRGYNISFNSATVSLPTQLYEEDSEGKLARNNTYSITETRTLSGLGYGSHQLSASGYVMVDQGNLNLQMAPVSAVLQFTVVAPTTRPSPTTAAPTQTTTRTPITSAQTTRQPNFIPGAKKVETTGVLNVRSGPGTEYPSVAQIDSGTVLDVAGRTDNGWYLTTFNGRTAYIFADYAIDYTPSTSTATRPATADVTSSVNTAAEDPTAVENNESVESTENSNSSDTDSLNSSGSESTGTASEHTTSTGKTDKTASFVMSSETTDGQNGLLTQAVDRSAGRGRADGGSLLSRIASSPITLLVLFILLLLVSLLSFILKRQKRNTDNERDNSDNAPNDRIGE